MANNNLRQIESESMRVMLNSQRKYEAVFDMHYFIGGINLRDMEFTKEEISQLEDFETMWVDGIRFIETLPSSIKSETLKQHIKGVIYDILNLSQFSVKRMYDIYLNSGMLDFNLKGILHDYLLQKGEIALEEEHQ